MGHISRRTKVAGLVLLAAVTYSATSLIVRAFTRPSVTTTVPDPQPIATSVIPDVQEKAVRRFLPAPVPLGPVQIGKRGRSFDRNAAARSRSLEAALRDGPGAGKLHGAWVVASVGRVDIVAHATLWDSTPGNTYFWSIDIFEGEPMPQGKQVAQLDLWDQALVTDGASMLDPLLMESVELPPGSYTARIILQRARVDTGFAQLLDPADRENRRMASATRPFMVK